MELFDTGVNSEKNGSVKVNPAYRKIRVLDLNFQLSLVILLDNCPEHD